MNAQKSVGALHGVRVLDLSRSVSGAWCARLFSDMGADVTLAEPPSGHPSWRLAPFAKDGRSIVAMFVLANRRSVVLEDGDGGQLASLVRGSDIVVVSARPAGGLAVSPGDLADIHPNAVVVAITPHGLTCTRSQFPGNDLTAWARSGWAAANGLVGREPLQGSGFIASYHAGTLAYGAAVSALLSNERHGGTPAGQCIDIAEDETLLEIFQGGFLIAQYQGEPPPRKRVRVVDTFPVPVADGHFSLALPPGERFRDAMLALGREEYAEDERFATPAGRQAHEDELCDAIEARLREQTRAELFDSLSVLRISAGPVLHMDELSVHPQLRARGYFVRPPDAADGPEYPGAPFRMSATPWSLGRSAPEPGADPAHVEPAAAVTPPRAGEAPARGPLEGLRVVALTHVWLGTFCTEQLALHGAEVIQVEARKLPDVWRGGYDGAIPAALGERDSARHSWNCSPRYNSVNLNKLAITLDLSDPEGRQLFLDLVRTADVLVENFSSRVMGNLGLSYEQLREVKPDLVMASCCAYGQSGPWSAAIGNGGTVEPTSGMSSLLGYLDSQPLNSGEMIPDPVGGAYGFAAIVSALHHRERTGEGQFIDLSMQEANLTYVGDAMLQYHVTGEVRPRMGNRHLTFAPHGIYPSAPGDGATEQWIALAAESELQWGALCELVGPRDWTTDPRFVNNAGRKQHEDALDAAIARWTAALPRDELADELCEAGVPASPVLAAIELAEDPVYRERGVIVEVEHPEVGRMPQIGIPYQYTRTPIAVTSPSPLHGEHSFAVLNRILGVTRERFEELEQRGVTGMGPPPGYGDE